MNIKKWMALVPVMCTFGPLEMVLGFDTPYHVVAMVAALITATGILIIFANVMQLLNPDITPVTLRDAPRGPLLLALGGVVVVGAIGVAFLLMRHPVQ